MNSRRWLRFTIVMTSILLWQSCGSGGEGSADRSQGDNLDQQQPPGGVNSSGLKEVKGRFVLGDTTTSAADFQIWKIDHTANALHRTQLASAGEFSWQLEEFESGHRYSFYLVGPELQGFGSIDLAPSVAGVQSSVLYSGGLGFDMGEMTIALTTSGRADADSTELNAELGGGFSLDETSTLSIEDLAFDTGLSTLQFGRHLLVLDPLATLYGIYLREEHPVHHARTIAEAQGIQIIASYDPEKVANVFVGEAGAWLKNSRIAQSAGASPIDSPLWAQSGFLLPEPVLGERRAYVYPPANLPANTIAFIKVWSMQGGAKDVPVRLGEGYSMPPRILGVSVDGSLSPETVDYSSDAANGVTVPFCLRGEDVVLEVATPLDAAGAEVNGSSHPFIDAQYSYFSDSGLLQPNAKSFSGAFSEPWEDETLPNFIRSWQPGQSTVRFEMSEDVFAASSHGLLLWSEIFLAQIGDEKVSKVRVKVVFTSRDGGSQAGIAIWFNQDC